MSMATSGNADDAQAVVRLHLRPGERVLWIGRPDVRAYSLRGVWYLIPFSVLWLGFAIFWESAVLSGGAPFPFALYGLPFILLGLYLVFGRLMVARREAQRALYAITDQRVFLLTGAFRPSFTEMDLTDVPPTQLTEESSGVGTIMFGATVGPFRVPPGWPTMGQMVRPLAFESIRDASRVYRILQDARSSRRGAPPIDQSADESRRHG